MADPAPSKRSKVPQDQAALARRLREERKREKFSMGELAVESGITKSALAHYEYGTAPLSFDAGNRICQRLNLNQRWLCTGLQPNRPFVDLPDLTRDSAILDAAGKLSFLEAYKGPLRAPLDRWHKVNPVASIIEKSVAGGVVPAVRRMSNQRLESFFAEHLSHFRKSDDVHTKIFMLGTLRFIVEELDRRYRRQKNLARAVTMCELTPVQIAEKVKAARARLGLTQRGAAEKWGVSIRVIQSYEQGTRRPRGLALMHLEQILRGENPPSG